MIRAVTVDWWHTLAEPHGGDWEAFAKRSRCEAMQRVLRDHGITTTYERLDVAYDLWTDHMKRAWRKNEDWVADDQILELLACAGYDGAADRALVAAMHEPIGSPLVLRPPEIHADAIGTLRTLRQSGLKISIISNTGRTWGRFLRQVQEKVGMGDLFDHRTWSDEARVRKPAAEIFEITLEALEVEAEEAVHVGDDVDADVGGAKGAGLRAVWYDTGKWPGADGARADAVVHSWRELPAALETWR